MFKRLADGAAVDAAELRKGDRFLVTNELWQGPVDPGDYGPGGEFAKTHLRLADMRFCTVSGLFPGDRARAVAGHTGAGPLVEARVILVARTYLTRGGVWNLEGSYED